MGPEQGAALEGQQAALVVVFKLLKVVHRELRPHLSLVLQVLRDRHPLLRLLRDDRELEPLVVLQEGQDARGDLEVGEHCIDDDDDDDDCYDDYYDDFGNVDYEYDTVGDLGVGRLHPGESWISALV